MKDNQLLTQIGKELEDAVFEQDAESIRYWTEYRADIMQQLVDGNIPVPANMTADQVVDRHVAHVRKMCEQFGTELPISRKIIPPGGSDGVLSPALPQKVLH